MPTIRQEKVARLIIENAKLDNPATGGQMLEKVRYGKISKQPSRVLKSKGVKAALKEYGFTEDNAKKVVSEILLNAKVKPDTRINAAKEVFKVQGSYAPEKSVSLNIEVPIGKQKTATDAIMRYLNGHQPNPTV